ncbi:MAG: hypothetical protein JXB85_05060 [Anaerolineales bacterium]|nr:hypothetical protein [Anaerolineales bacterium]
MAADTVRFLLFVFLLAMYVLAILYLRRRPLPLLHFLAWGLFALLIPLLGPFVVILCRPGGPGRGHRVHGSFRR